MWVGVCVGYNTLSWPMLSHSLRRCKTSAQQCLNAGNATVVMVDICRHPSKNETLIQCCFNVDPPSTTRRWSNVILMLAHRLRRWTNIKTTMDQRLVLAGYTYTLYSRLLCISAGKLLVVDCRMCVDPHECDVIIQCDDDQDVTVCVSLTARLVTCLWITVRC